MPDEVWTTLQAWALALLLYPGLLFAGAVALIGEWITSVVWSLLRRAPRSQSRPRPFAYPAHNTIKLAGRRGPTAWPGVGGSSEAILSSLRALEVALALMCVIAPVLALALIPFPGSPLTSIGLRVDLLTLLLLLAVQPIARAVLRLQSGELRSLRGAQDIGKLLTGLVPILIAVAALVEVSGNRSLQLASLTAAPETAAQTLVRLVAGAVLLLALPWWLDWNGNSTMARESAGIYAGRLMQTAALAGFWSIVVLPAPGQLVWGIVIYFIGTLFAYAAMRSYERFSPARREKDAASVAWATALPAASVALVVAILWPGV